jgi:hypothetical protein
MPQKKAAASKKATKKQPVKVSRAQALKKPIIEFEEDEVEIVDTSGGYLGRDLEQHPTRNEDKAMPDEKDDQNNGQDAEQPAAEKETEKPAEKEQPAAEEEVPKQHYIT